MHSPSLIDSENLKSSLDAPRSATRLAVSLREQCIAPANAQLKELAATYQRVTGEIEEAFNRCSAEIERCRTAAETAANEQLESESKEAQRDHTTLLRTLEQAYMDKRLPHDAKKHKIEQLDRRIRDARDQAEHYIVRHGFAPQQAVNLVRSQTGLEEVSSEAPSDLVLTVAEIASRVDEAEIACKSVAHHEAPKRRFRPDSNNATIWLWLVAFGSGTIVTLYSDGDAMRVLSFLGIPLVMFYTPLLLVRRASRRKVLGLAHKVYQLRFEVKVSIQQLLSQSEQSLHFIQAAHDVEKTAAEEKHEQRMSALKQNHSNSITNVNATHETLHREAIQEQSEASSAADANLRNELCQFVNTIGAQVDVISKEWDRVSHELQFATAGWEADEWQRWSHATDSDFAAQFGRLRMNLGEVISIPNLEGANVKDVIEELRSKLVTLELPALAPFALNRGLLRA